MAEHQLMPLEDRILALVKDEVMFNFKRVRELFPNEGEKTLYRAMQKLEDQQRIRFLHWHQRGKVFTAVGQSNLPHIKTFSGETVPVSLLLTGISGVYEDGRYDSLAAINELPALIAWFFAVALIEDEKEMRKQFVANHHRLSEVKATLNVLMGYCDSMLKHPTLSGDLEYFKSVFASESDSTVPSAEEVSKFKVWYKREIVDRRNEKHV